MRIPIGGKSPQELIDILDHGDDKSYEPRFSIDDSVKNAFLKENQIDWSPEVTEIEFCLITPRELGFTDGWIPFDLTIDESLLSRYSIGLCRPIDVLHIRNFLNPQHEQVSLRTWVITEFLKVGGKGPTGLDATGVFEIHTFCTKWLGDVRYSISAFSCEDVGAASFKNSESTKLIYRKL